MISPRVSGTASGFGAFGESWFTTAVYNDTTGSLLPGMPLYVDVRDAAEYNTSSAPGNTTTALASASPNYNVASAGQVVLGTNANAGSNPCFVGVFAPPSNSLTVQPANGAQIRLLVYGYGIVLTTGTVTVGENILINTGANQAVGGAPVTKKNIGTALATSTAVTNGATIPTTLVNAFIAPC